MNNIIFKNKLKNIAIIIMIAIFFIADRYLKSLALSQAQNPPFRLIGDLLSFDFAANYYMAFSLPITGKILNITILLVISALILYIFYLIINKYKNRTVILLLTLILFGAISNILDRLFFGYVIDYLYLKYFTVFNLADVCIFLTTSYLIFLSLVKKSPMIIAENLNFVLEAVKKAASQTSNRRKKVSPTKENAVELLMLHDLEELIRPAKMGGSYDQGLLVTIISEDYKRKFQSGKCSAYYNFRKVLEKPEYFEHFQALISEQLIFPN